MVEKTKEEDPLETFRKIKKDKAEQHIIEKQEISAQQKEISAKEKKIAQADTKDLEKKQEISAKEKWEITRDRVNGKIKELSREAPTLTGELQNDTNRIKEILNANTSEKTIIFVNPKNANNLLFTYSVYTPENIYIPARI